MEGYYFNIEGSANLIIHVGQYALPMSVSWAKAVARSERLYNEIQKDPHTPFTITFQTGDVRIFQIVADYINNDGMLPRQYAQTLALRPEPYGDLVELYGTAYMLGMEALCKKIENTAGDLALRFGCCPSIACQNRLRQLFPQNPPGWNLCLIELFRLLQGVNAVPSSQGNNFTNLNIDSRTIGRLFANSNPAVANGAVANSTGNADSGTDTFGMLELVSPPGTATDNSNSDQSQTFNNLNINTGMGAFDGNTNPGNWANFH